MPARPKIRTKAIVLGRTKLSEQDLILTLLAEAGDQVRCVAKGARKPGGRLASRVELFCETDFLIALGRNLGIVSEASLTDAHDQLRGDLDRVSAASVVAELARLTSYEDVQDPFMYAICSRALTACEQAADQPHLDLVVAAYAFKVLSHAGWRPELSSCIACGEEDLTYFSCAMGGALCESCAKDVQDLYELTPNELDWIRALISLTFDQLLEAEVSTALAVLLLSIAHGWCATHLETRLRAFEFLLSL